MKRSYLLFIFIVTVLIPQLAYSQSVSSAGPVEAGVILDNYWIRIDGITETGESRVVLSELQSLNTSRWTETQQATLAQMQGSMLVGLGDYVGAITQFERYYFSDSTPIKEKYEVLNTLGMLNMAVENYATAIPLIEKYIMESDEADEMHWFRLAQSYFMIDQFAEAKLPMENALVIAEDGATGRAKEDWYTLYYGILSGLGEKEVAMAMWEQKKKLGPNAETRRSLITLMTGTATDEYLPFMRVEPIYPPELAAQKIEGYVIVEYTVAADGRVIRAFVIEAEPMNVFDESALRAVRAWRHKPRVVNGTPVAVDGVRSKLTFGFQK